MAAAAPAHVPYSLRPEWSDVAPVQLPGGSERVVAIQYTPEHADALAYLRAVLQSGELSERVLLLTTDIIRFNQADYTAWRLRWLCVQHLGPEALAAEFDFTHAVMIQNAKNYQLWNHRRLCALQVGPSAADREEEFTREAINFDEKNYHAWAHRQAIAKVSGRWESELAFTHEMLERDVRNNTAWNHRMFVLKHMPRSAQDDDEWLRGELAYVAAAIQKAPRNEAPWRFLTGIFATLEPWASKPRALSRYPEVYTLCQEALNDCASCAPAYDVLAEYYEGLAAFGLTRASAEVQAAGPGALAPATLEGVLQACDIAQAALDEAALADPMRTPFWYHRQRGLTHMLASATAMLQ